MLVALFLRCLLIIYLVIRAVAIRVSIVKIHRITPCLYVIF